MAESRVTIVAPAEEHAAEKPQLSITIDKDEFKRPPLPPVEIRYENLSYSVMLTKKEAAVATHPSVFGTVAGLFTAPVRLFGSLLRGNLGPQREQKTIIKAASGVIKPGTLTLLLAPPGHGKSALLKLITKQIDSKFTSGNITFSGSKDGVAEGCHLPQLVQYVSQLDEHLPHLTVRETLQFVAANATVNPAHFGFPHLKESHDKFVDDTINLLHLNNCENTMIGNELLRGVSGGEKKRVTVGEGLTTNARVLALDEISTGLDSAVTYDIVRALKARAQSTGMSAVIALLQPTPEVFSLFDDIILLREGCVVYHGPREQLGSHFATLGFNVPAANASGVIAATSSISATSVTASDEVDAPTSPTAASERIMDLADWLISMLTDPSRFLTHTATQDDAARSMTTDRMVEAWNASDIHKAQMAAPPSAPHLKLEGAWAQTQYGRAYSHAFGTHLWLLIKRQFLLMRRNPLYVRARLATAIIMGVVLGGLYWQLETLNGITYYGTFLNAVMNAGFGNLGEMAVAIEQKYVAYKHVAHGNYPGGAFVLAGAIAHVPLSIMVNLVHIGIIYGMAGLVPGADHFFFMLLVCILVDIFFRNMLVMFCYAFRSVQAAQSMPMPVIALLILFAGFLVAPSKMGWLTFVYYIDILGYALRSLAQNEFLSSRYDRPVAGTTQTLGELFLSTMGIETDPVWKWAGVGFAIGACLIVILSSYFIFSRVRTDNNIGSQRADPDKLAKSKNKSKSKRVANGAMGKAAPSAATAINAAAVAEDAIARTVSVSKMRFDPMTVVFKDIKYTVRLAKHAGGGNRTLLHGITGYALPGRMLALMGASGAGKTTLLDVLAGRKNSGKLEGKILLNGFPKNEATFNRVTAYVEQMDIHSSLSTVRESVEFSARLRLPSSVSHKVREEFVDEVLQLLELNDIQHRIVGVAGGANSLAPGERKRLSIAVELASNAPVIFLDEPTSGLDARAAEIVMRVVRKIADTGRTIICTIHQPSAELFFMFDDLLLVQRGGWQVYLGPIGDQGSNIVSYLSDVPNFPAYPAGMNPSSWMLDGLGGYGNVSKSAEVMQPTAAPSADAEVMDGGISVEGGDVILSPTASPPPSPVAMPSAQPQVVHVHEHSVHKHGEIQERFHASEIWRQVCEVAERHSTPAPGAGEVSFPSRHAHNFFVQYSVLVRRFWRSYKRNVGLNIGRWSALTILFLLFGTVYYKIAGSANDMAGVQSLIAAIFLVIAFSAMLNMNTSLPPTFAERAVLYREVASYMYDSVAYSLAHTTVELPWLCLIIMATLPIIYFMMGLSASAAVFFYHYLVTVTLTAVFVMLGYTLASALPNFEVAQAASGIISPLFFLFGGMWAPPSQMVPGARWFCWIDPITYAFRAIIPVHFYCEGAGCPTMQVVTDDGLVPEDRYQWISNKYDVHYADRWENLGYLAIFIIVFQITTILATRYVRHITR